MIFHQIVDILVGFSSVLGGLLFLKSVIGSLTDLRVCWFSSRSGFVV